MYEVGSSGGCVVSWPGTHSLQQALVLQGKPFGKDGYEDDRQFHLLTYVKMYHC